MVFLVFWVRLTAPSEDRGSALRRGKDSTEEKRKILQLRWRPSLTILYASGIHSLAYQDARNT